MMMTMSKLLICYCHQHRGGARWKVHRLYLALKSCVTQSELHRPPTFASPGRAELWERAGQGKGMLWGCGAALLSCLGGILHTPEQDSGKRPYTFGVTLENPFQHKMGTKCGAESNGEVRWPSQPHQDKHSNLEISGQMSNVG